MNHKQLIIISVVAFLLSLPLIAMVFTDEVRWNLMDFIIAGSLLLSLGFLIEYTSRKLSNRRSRILVLLSTITVFLVVWLELAVGIFGTALAGS